MNKHSIFDVCIVGLGPAGIGAALTLSKSFHRYRVILLDVGSYLDQRYCHLLQEGSCKNENPCSMICGIGGASLFGGHKISMFPAGRKIGNILGSEDFAKNKLSQSFKLLSTYLPLKAPNISKSDIIFARDFFKTKGFEYRYYDAYLCSNDALHHAYKDILSQLRNANFTVLLNNRVTKVSHDNHYFTVSLLDNPSVTKIQSKYLVVGAGRSGHELLSSLNREMNLGGRVNHLEIGVRLEFPTELFSEIDKFHKDLKLLKNDIRTFCVCKRGRIIPYFLHNMFILDGYYDLSHETNLTNLSIMLRLKPSDRNEQVFEEIRKRIHQISNGKPVRQTLISYLDGKDKIKSAVSRPFTSFSFWSEGNVNKCFPPRLSRKIREGVNEFVSAILTTTRWKEVSVFAPAIEYNWLHFPMKADFSIIPRMYLIGDCTGNFRGILQAFSSGIVCAESINASEH